MATKNSQDIKDEANEAGWLFQGDEKSHELSVRGVQASRLSLATYTASEWAEQPSKRPRRYRQSGPAYSHPFRLQLARSRNGRGGRGQPTEDKEGIRVGRSKDGRWSGPSWKLGKVLLGDGRKEQVTERTSAFTAFHWQHLASR